MSTRIQLSDTEASTISTADTFDTVTEQTTSGIMSSQVYYWHNDERLRTYNVRLDDYNSQWRLSQCIGTRILYSATVLYRNTLTIRVLIMCTHLCNHFRFASAFLNRLSLNYERFL